jgi:xanthine dehydrogenase accessory factor
MKPIAATARQLLSAGAPFVLATIFSRHGSAPRTAGTRMIVAADGRATGTIGGGLFEARVAERASEVLASKVSAVLAFDMSHDDVTGMDMICGGRVEVLLEYIKPGTAAAAVYAALRDPERTPEPCLLVTMVRFAAGKMSRITHGLLRDGQAICGDLQFDEDVRQAVNQDRDRTPTLQTVTLPDALILVQPVGPSETVFIFGAGHVAKPAAGLAKLVGFRVWVRKQVFDGLSREGFSERDLNRVHSPIGIDIGAESCEEIAISIVAELVQARARNRGR